MAVWPGEDCLFRKRRERQKVILISSSSIHFPYSGLMHKYAREIGLIWQSGERCWRGEPDAIEKIRCRLSESRHFRSFKQIVSDYLLADATIVIEPMKNGLYHVCSGPISQRLADVLLNWRYEIRWLGIAHKAAAVEEVVAIVKDKELEALKKEIKEMGANVVLGEMPKSSLPARLEFDGWIARVRLDVRDPRHLVFASPKTSWKSGVPIPISWNPELVLTRATLPKLHQTLVHNGIALIGSDLITNPVRAPVALKLTAIAGWNSPAANGNLLHDFQRDGVEFCAARGMRSLIADEMGTGKTVQAIACAQGAQTKKILVICPRVARYVWDSEIRSWRHPNDSEPRVWHSASSIDIPPPNTEWSIVTYDQIIQRSATIKLSAAEAKAVGKLKTLPDGVSLRFKPDRICVEKATMPPLGLQIPDTLRVRWERAIGRMLQKTLLERLLKWQPDMVIADEAHRLKNNNAKRTNAVRQFSNAPYFLALTGTPVRNHAGETATLLTVVDPMVFNPISELAAVAPSPYEPAYEEGVREFIDWYMIRRRKIDVLPELPTKIRQWIAIEPTDRVQAVRDLKSAYHMALAEIRAGDGIKAGHLGAIERAAAVLVRLKVEDGQIADAIADMVAENERNCVIVFGRHLQALDKLNQQLCARNLRVVQVDGRSKDGRERDKAQQAFQAGKADVFLGSIGAGGESITLTRADTCVFIELPWVPADLLQAEDRGHRDGQKSAGYHVVYFHAQGYEIDDLLVRLHREKIERSNRMLREAQTIFDDRVDDMATSLIHEAVMQLRTTMDTKKGGRHEVTRSLHSHQKCEN
jgi:superfamily II DNA or RNA helicase